MSISSADQAPRILKLLANDLRWQIVVALGRTDLKVQELMARTDRPQNLVSCHLKQLRDGGLVAERRSSADARDIYHSLDLDRLRRGFAASGEALHPGLPRAGWHTSSEEEWACPARVLFLCTHNSARSQMAEALLRSRGPSSLEVFSAGSEPAAVHPLAIEAMAEMGIDMRGQVAKHFDQFAGQHFDYVITVCDRVRQVCLVFGDEPQAIHWSLPDPAAVSGPPAECYKAFRETAAELVTRIDFLLPVLVKPAKRMGENDE